MDFLQVDVFSDRPFTGNQLAVFPAPADLDDDQMQAIAQEMNLSETTFVTAASGDSYDVRIFTPGEELPFAGHPTLGTTWVLRHLGMISGDPTVQRSAAGETPVESEDDVLWLTRSGVVHDDLESVDPDAAGKLAEALGLQDDDIGADGRLFGGQGRLAPAFSDAGVEHLTVPLRDVAALERCNPRSDLLGAIANGAYCVAPVGEGKARSRGFFPGLGVSEDPGTGMAVAGLGIYLGDRIGGASLEIMQGVEMGRPCRIFMKSEPGRVKVGGRCRLVLEGKLTALPGVD